MADIERWEPPTMKSIRALDGNPLVTCSCGRVVNADMMRVSGAGFACDACLDRQFKTGAMTAEDFAVSQGAPPDVVERARALDATQSTRVEEIAARSAGPAST